MNNKRILLFILLFSFYVNEITANNAENLIAIKRNDLAPVKKEQLLKFSDSGTISSDQVRSPTAITKMSAIVAMPLLSIINFIK